MIQLRTNLIHIYLGNMDINGIFTKSNENLQ